MLSCSDFEWLTKLQKKNGVDLGENYLNEKRCKDFVLAAADQLLDEVRFKLSCARFMTVLADGSTDASVVEQETVSVRYIHKGEPVTELAKIVPLESGKATGVYEAVKQGITAVKGEPGPSLIGANFDGASVMMVRYLVLRHCY